MKLAVHTHTIRTVLKNGLKKTTLVRTVGNTYQFLGFPSVMKLANVWSNREKVLMAFKVLWTVNKAVAI